MGGARGGREKLLILGTNGGIGGTQRVILDLTRELRQHGHAVTTLFPDNDSGRATLEWFAQEGVEAGASDAIPDSSQPVARGAGDIRKLARLIRAHRPTAVNLHYPTRQISLKDVLAVRLASRAKLLVTVQHPAPFSPHREYEKHTLRAAAALCNHVVISTPYMAQLLGEARVSPRVMTTIPLGAQPPASRPAKEDARRQLGISPDEFLILTVTRMETYKGLDPLIQAFSTLDVPGKRLIAVGQGSQLERLRAEAERTDPHRIRFPGHVPDLAPLYAAADLFVLPSQEEGFGLVFVEAAFYGVPSVAAAVWGVPYVVKDEETGLLVAPNDAQALSAAMARLAMDRALLGRLGAAAQRRAERELTAATMAARYEALIYA